MVTKRKFIWALRISGLHAALLVTSLLFGGLSMSSLDEVDPTSTELIMGKASSILMQPASQVKGMIGITTGSGVEWILFLFNSAIWGCVVSPRASAV
jgi:hypothetical protein